MNSVGLRSAPGRARCSIHLSARSVRGSGRIFLSKESSFLGDALAGFKTLTGIPAGIDWAPSRGSFIVLNRVTFSIGPWGRLLWLPCLLACAPSPEVAQAGAGHASWDRTATRTPTPPDADVTTIEPPDQ